MRAQLWAVVGWVVVFTLLVPIVKATEGFAARGALYPTTLFRRLAGVPLSPRRSDYSMWQELISRQDWPAFAALATEEPGFVDITALHWATIYYTAGQSAYEPLDDALATLVGSVRDDRDARLLLSGDYLYGPEPRLGLETSVNDNFAYQVLEARGLSLKTVLRYKSPQWSLKNYEAAAGLLTTRSWAALNYGAGTNRRAIRATFESFLCRPNATWMVPNLPAERIRRDVDRASGGDARIFQQSCRSCHTTLDGLSGAFAHLDFRGSSFFVTPDVLPKYLQHSEVYPEGHVPTDDSWINYLALASDPLAQSFQWRGLAQGRGVTQLGEMLSASGAFSACLAKRAFAVVCMQDRLLTDPVIRRIAAEFESNDSYGLKKLFIRTALSPECI